MLKRLLAVFVLAVSLTACGSGGVTITKKIINSDNGEPLIEYSVKFLETLIVFRDVAEDMNALCESGAATGLPAAPVAGVPYVVTFTDCVIHDITLNGSVTITFSLFNSWTDMAYTLDLGALMAAADWFGGTATFTGELDFSILDTDATITLLTAPLTAEVLTGDMGKLVLNSLTITISQSNANPDFIIIGVSGRGEISNSSMANPIAVKVATETGLRLNTVNPDALCPKRGYISVAATKDGSFASIEYPEDIPNVYWIGTNDSYKQRKCT